MEVLDSSKLPDGLTMRGHSRDRQGSRSETPSDVCLYIINTAYMFMSRVDLIGIRISMEGDDEDDDGVTVSFVS